MTNFINRAALAAAIEIVERVVPSSGIFPILEHVRIRNNAGWHDSVVLSGTDMDISVSVTIDAELSGNLDTTINAKSIKTLLKGAPKSSNVELDVPSDVAVLDLGKAKYRLPTFPASDVPETKFPGVNASVFSMPGRTFADALSRVFGAVSTEETRYYLNGIYFTQETGGRLRMVATDGHRLYAQCIETPAGLDGIAGHGQPGVIIPSSAVKILLALMAGKKCPASIDFRLDASNIMLSWQFEFGRVEYVSKLVDGTFPDYARVLPKNADNVAMFNRAELTESVKAASLLGTEKSKPIKIILEKDGAGKLVSRDTGDGSSSVDIATQWRHDEFEIGVNSRYLLAALATQDDESATLSFADAGSPFILTGANPDFMAVLMPMRI